MFFKSLDLTTALRPLLLPDETLLFVQDAVGLYEGWVAALPLLACILIRAGRKYKIPNYQNGHAYLTSHRVCYIAAEEPRKFSVGIDLREVDRAEYQVGAPDSCSMKWQLTRGIGFAGGFSEIFPEGDNIPQATEEQERQGSKCYCQSCCAAVVHPSAGQTAIPASAICRAASTTSQASQRDMDMPNMLLF